MASLPQVSVVLYIFLLLQGKQNNIMSIEVIVIVLYIVLLMGAEKKSQILTLEKTEFEAI